MHEIQLFRDLLVAEVRRRIFEENVPRIKQCLGELAEAEIWYRPNENSNSVGNLVLHLCGNVRQWILSGLGGQEDKRRRQQEFDEAGPIPTAELLRHLDSTMAETAGVLDALPAEKILQVIEVQGFKETGLSILVHVVEHFSYHTGQITYFVKWRKNMDMGYYDGVNLEVPGH
jgi:uncharacterized damage-inducible protein DinB